MRLSKFLKHVDRVEVLQLREGDVLLLTAPNDISVEQAAYIKDHFEAVLGDVPFKVVVSSGLTFKVIRENGGDACNSQDLRV